MNSNDPYRARRQPEADDETSARTNGSSSGSTRLPGAFLWNSCTTGGAPYNDAQNAPRKSHTMMRNIVDGIITPFVQCVQPACGGSGGGGGGGSHHYYHERWNMMARNNNTVLSEGSMVVSPFHDDRKKNDEPRSVPYHYPIKDRKMSHSTDRPDAVVAAPHMNDVLCGRGGSSVQHPGNVHFRELIAANKACYATLTKKQKMIMARHVVELVRSTEPPGRFLARELVSPVDNAPHWHDIGLSRSLEKTSQALREKTAAERQSDSSDVGIEVTTADVVMDETSSSADVPSTAAVAKSVGEAPPVVIPAHLRSIYGQKGKRQHVQRPTCAVLPLSAHEIQRQQAIRQQLLQQQRNLTSSPLLQHVSHDHPMYAMARQASSVTYDLARPIPDAPAVTIIEPTPQQRGMLRRSQSNNPQPASQLVPPAAAPRLERVSRNFGFLRARSKSPVALTSEQSSQLVTHCSPPPLGFGGVSRAGSAQSNATTRSNMMASSAIRSTAVGSTHSNKSWDGSSSTAPAATLRSRPRQTYPPPDQRANIVRSASSDQVFMQHQQQNQAGVRDMTALPYTRALSSTPVATPTYDIPARAKSFDAGSQHSPMVANVLAQLQHHIAQPPAMMPPGAETTRADSFGGASSLPPGMRSQPPPPVGYDQRSQPQVVPPSTFEFMPTRAKSFDGHSGPTGGGASTHDQSPHPRQHYSAFQHSASSDGHIVYPMTILRPTLPAHRRPSQSHNPPGVLSKSSSSPVYVRDWKRQRLQDLQEEKKDEHAAQLARMSLQDFSINDATKKPALSSYLAEKNCPARRSSPLHSLTTALPLRSPSSIAQGRPNRYTINQDKEHETDANSSDLKEASFTSMDGLAALSTAAFLRLDDDDDDETDEETNDATTESGSFDDTATSTVED